MEKLLDALPDMELAVPVSQLEWRPGFAQRALTALPVRFPPVRAPQTRAGSAADPVQAAWQGAPAQGPHQGGPAPAWGPHAPGSAPRPSAGPARRRNHLSRWWHGE